MNITYSEHVRLCVCVDLVIQHAKKMRRILLTYFASLAVPSSSVLKGTIFEKKVIE